MLDSRDIAASSAERVSLHATPPVDFGISVGIDPLDLTF